MKIRPINTQNKYLRISILFCICFLLGSIFFVSDMMKRNDQDNAQFIESASKQVQISIQKQIEGDLQTLEGVSTVIGNSGFTNDEEMLPILKKINDKNTFIRMGFAKPDGEVFLVDIDGSSYQFNISERNFFKNAMQGQESISEFFEDSINPGHLINYYGMPVYNKQKEIIGVLCAVNSDQLIQQIINPPLYNQHGFSGIIDHEGNIIIRSSSNKKEILPDKNIMDLDFISSEEKANLKKAIDNGNSTTFNYAAKNGENMAVINPIIHKRWYVVSVIPKTVLQQRYIMTAIGVMGIIVIATGAFLFFLIQQRRTIIRNRDKIMEIAYRDDVTGMRSYSKFLIDADEFMKQHRGKPLIIWYSDMKKFKYFNDVLGYRVGDDILKGFATIFTKACNNAPLCRISGDYFTGIMVYENHEQIESWYHQVLHDIAERQSFNKTQLTIEMCFGFYTPPQNNELSLNEMVNRASMAQKAVKHLSGNRYRFYDDHLRDVAIDETTLLYEGRKSLEDEDFVLYFQPKINIKQNDAISGAEVLARWKHPTKGILTPDKFIPQFEANGMIVDLDRYMFALACAWLRQAIDQGFTINLAVNISRLDLLRNDFIDYYVSIKNQYRIPDGLLELELTESLITGEDIFKNMVDELHEHGFICSMDDFGSGYSSLNILKNLPIDTLKLDIAFFKKSVNKTRERIVISSILEMARKLDIHTVAEGVDNLDTLEFLKTSSCDAIQGFIYAKPMKQSIFDELLKQLNGGPMPIDQ